MSSALYEKGLLGPLLHLLALTVAYARCSRWRSAVSPRAPVPVD